VVVHDDRNPEILVGFLPARRPRRRALTAVLLGDGARDLGRVAGQRLTQRGDEMSIIMSRRRDIVPEHVAEGRGTLPMPVGRGVAETNVPD
jgi:hypothetical protein